MSQSSSPVNNHANFLRPPCPLRLPHGPFWREFPARALAGELADFNAAVEAASSHNRVAIGYLRTGNTDLASLEIDRLRDAWRKLTARFAGHAPDARRTTRSTPNCSRPLTLASSAPT